MCILNVYIHLYVTFNVSQCIALFAMLDKIWQCYTELVAMHYEIHAILFFSAKDILYVLPYIFNQK